MAKITGLDSSYIYSLTSQLGTGQDASDQMTSFLSEFKTDGDLLIDQPGPFNKDDKPIVSITEDFLSDFGDILWPPYGQTKDQKLRWPTDKEKITDWVSTIFLEKLRLYKQQHNKDLNVDIDTKDTTPQPPITNGDAAADTAEGDRKTYEQKVETPAKKSATDETTAPTTTNDPEDGAIHLVTSRNRGNARASTSARASEVASSAVKATPEASPINNQYDDGTKPHKFKSVDDYREGIIEALDRAKEAGVSLTGAIQLVRTTLNETLVRDAISSAASNKRIGTIRLTQINDRFMAWVFEKNDGTCFWVKPYKGKVINGIIRYAGWTGADGVFTNYPVTYGTISKDAETPKSSLKETPSSAVKRVGQRSATGTGNTTSKIVNLKLRRNTDNGNGLLLKGSPAQLADSQAVTPADTTPAAATPSKFPSYIKGESATMERARHAVLSGNFVDPPCTFCTDSGNTCMMAERGRTCAFCIAMNRTATDCERAREGVASKDYEPTVTTTFVASPVSSQPVLTHSGRVSKRPTRDDYIDRSENDSDSALSSISVEDREPPRDLQSSKLRRKSSALRSTPSLKRTRDSTHGGNAIHDIKSGANAGQQLGTNSASAASTTVKPSRMDNRIPDVWFSFSSSEPKGAPKLVAAKDVMTMNAFFDAAIAAWRKSGGNVDVSFHGVEATWPERPMFVEWRDEKDWERMMTMLKRSHGDDHGEVEVEVRYRLAR